MKTPILLTFSFFLSFYPPIDTVLKRLLLQLNQFRQQYPIEKVFVHTDKSVYLPKETLWFKAYLTLGAEQQKDTLSKVLYVDLLRNADSSIVSQKTLYITDSQTNGNIDIPEFTAAGDYTLRVYTNWMKNFGDKYLFYSPIKIVAQTGINQEKTAEKNQIQALFFPEGGYLFENYNNLVGFRTLDAKTKKGIPCKVGIYENDMLLANYDTNFDGIGSFYIDTKDNFKYSAKIILENNQTIEQNFPEITKNGIGFHVDNLSSEAEVKIQVALLMPNEQKPNKLFLISHQRGKPCHATVIEIKDKKLKKLNINVPKRKFKQEGIVTFTLFDAQGLPLAERLIYSDFAKNTINIKLKVEGKNEQKSKITLNIRAKDAEDNPIEGSFSISALAMINDLKNWQNIDIYQYMMLGSEIGFYSSNISNYFSGNKKNSMKLMDDLLLTQKWSRFEWRKAFIPWYPAQENLTIKGTVLDKTNYFVTKEPALISISDAQLNNQSRFITTDNRGQFEINDWAFRDSTNVSVRFTNKKNVENYILLIEKPENGLKNPFLLNWEHIPNEAINYLATLNKNGLKEIALEDVNINARKIEKPQIVMDGRRMYKEAEMIINLDKGQASNYTNILEYISTNPNILGKGLTSTRGKNSIMGNNQALFLLDGTPTEPSTLASIPVTLVETIEVIKSAKAAILFGSRGTNGVVNILTRSAKNMPIVTNDDDFSSQLVAKTNGYSIVKTFYSPDYEKEKTDKLDYRTTLLWQPNVKTDKKGRATVTFYNNDLQTPLLVKINGTDFYGNFGGLEYLIEK